MYTSKLLTILFCLFTGFSTVAQGINYSNAQDMAYSKNIIRQLASPEFKGRGYVEDGAHKAAALIASEFTKYGLSPVLPGSYFQEYKLDVNTFPGTVFLQLDQQVLTTAVDYLVSASSPSIKGKFNVIHINRAQLKTEAAATALTAGAENAFIILDNRFATTETAEERQLINQNIERLEYDERLDFKGLIIYTFEKLTWTTAAYQSIRPVLTLNRKDIDLQNIKQIQIEIEARFLKNERQYNVIGMVKGTAVPDSMLVITAHYDHLGMLGNKVYFPGANDNASGTAMLLRLASYYSKNPAKYSLVFIAFSGEEIGLLGSAAFVKNPLIDLKKIKFLTNFDLAGTGEEGIRVVNGTVYPDRFDQLVKLNAQDKLLTKVDIRGEACNSDHCRFYQLGVPGFFIYTQGGIAAYHDIHDRVETLSLFAFDNYFKLMQRFLNQF